MGHFKNNQKGFTLVEVMITAAIMGAMAIYFTRYFSDQMKQQKTVMIKMEEANLINEIRLHLMNVDNCTESLKENKIKIQGDGKVITSDEIKNLSKKYTLLKKDKDPEVTIVEKYIKWEKEKAEFRYGQDKLKIHSYGFSISKESFKYLQKFKIGDIDFVVTLDRGKGGYGSQLKAYKVPLEIAIDKSSEIISCSSMGLPAGGEAGMVALDTKTIPGLSGNTGEEACRTKKLSCAYVQSTNYLLNSTGGLDTGYYAHSCTSSYNQSLKGIKNGGGLSNIHSCDAKIGVFETFKLPIGKGEMICAGTFVAVCN